MELTKELMEQYGISCSTGSCQKGGRAAADAMLSRFWRKKASCVLGYIWTMRPEGWKLPVKSCLILIWALSETTLRLYRVHFEEMKRLARAKQRKIQRVINATGGSFTQSGRGPWGQTCV